VESLNRARADNTRAYTELLLKATMTTHDIITFMQDIF
jgi:hypothetical protein